MQNKSVKEIKEIVDNLKVDQMSINDKINLKMLIMDKYNINSFEI